MLFAMPITPGTSKAAMATVSIQMTADIKAGHMSGSSTRSRVLNLLTPWMLAASTRAGFMPRKAAAIITHASGVNVNPSTNPMPGNSGPEAHPHDHRQESDDGQRRDPRDA